MTAKLTFNDDFNSFSVWNGSSGTWSTNWWYKDEWGLYSKSNGSTLPTNGEHQWYINANYAPTASVKPWVAQDGALTITAKPADPSIQPLIDNYKFTSGMVNTWHSFSQQYGYFEMRADLPAGQGLWPAFWLLPQDGSWPPELDVVEVLGNDPSRIYTTAHSQASGSHTMESKGTTVVDTSNGYHTYGVDWQADKITFYFDNQQIFQTPTPADMHKPMYMIANLAVGGHWPGAPDGSTPFPAEMKIDHIRAWDSNPYVNGGATAPVASAPTASAPTTSAPAAQTSGGGQVVVATDSYARLTGGSGADTLHASQGYDTLTGGAGADSFVLGREPWAPIRITDFALGEDKLDLSALFQASGYSGSDPVRDGYVHFARGDNGGSIVRFDRDGAAAGQRWPNTIVSLDNVSTADLDWSRLSGSGGGTSTKAPAPVTTTTTTTSSAQAGQVLTAAGSNSTLTGGAGADTLKASEGYDVLTGGAGADVFTFAKEPWAPIHITDFKTGEDKLDLRALFQKSGYAGSNPIGDRYMYVESDGAGGALLRFDRDAGGGSPVWPNTIIDLRGVAPSQVQTSDWII